MKDANEGGLTLNRQAMEKLAKERIVEISHEFSAGFEFLEDYPKSVTFFGGTRFDEAHPYYQSARTLAGRLAKELGYAVVSGGGPGIMEAANRGAYEAGGNSLGLLIKLPKGQPINRYITKHISSYYFFARKVLLAFSAEAFIFFPGGFGTLDEFFEIMTLVQTKKVEGVPIICVGSDYWSRLKEFMEQNLLGRDTIDPEDLELFYITDDHEEIIDIIRKVPVRTVLPFNTSEAKDSFDIKITGKA